MSAKNDFKAFAISDKANVPSQQEYEAYARLPVGFEDGQYIPNHMLNKALRQASTISSV
ncbi:phage tail protein, partial [Photorhabdus luminescens]